MIIRLEARNGRGQTLVLPLVDTVSGYRVEEIGGLDPVKATLVSTSFANMDGEQYQSSRRDARQLTLKLGIETGNALSVKALRAKLYDFFMPKSNSTLTFVQDDAPDVEIGVYTESLEAPLFAEEPTADITMMCFDPDFREAAPTTFSGNTTAITNDSQSILYEGSVETGIDISINVNRLLSEFTIYHRPPNGALRSLDFQASMASGDVVRIVTTPGFKSTTISRSGTVTSALYAVSPQSNWIELVPGVNELSVYAEGAAIPYTIEYVTRYGGL